MPEISGISVSELNILIADTVRRSPFLQKVTVRGEISGFKNHFSSGHWYFSLKDEESSVSCVMFRTYNMRTHVRPVDGMSVTVYGHVDVYPKTGSCQLYITAMKPDGAGDMYRRFEELKRKLMAEGLFDPSRKKILPMVPKKVAVVTSQSGAAIHDIINVSGARAPRIPIVLVPVSVQGSGAGREIAAGIAKAAGIPDVDVIIVGRGGGSPEDLWCFNEECVARAAASCPVPVVSGVGHEIDTTICDLAADVRAATPSNAAEIVFPDGRELYGRISILKSGLCRAVDGVCASRQLFLTRTRSRLAALSPETRLGMLITGVTELKSRLTLSMRSSLERREMELKLTRTSLSHNAGIRTGRAEAVLRQIRSRLEGLSPYGVLSRGYAMIYSTAGDMISSAKDAVRHSEMEIRFIDDRVKVVRKEESNG